MKTFNAQEAHKLAKFLGSVNLADALDVVLHKICVSAKEGHYSTLIHESFIKPEIKEHLIKEGYTIEKTDSKYYKVSW